MNNLRRLGVDGLCSTTQLLKHTVSPISSNQFAFLFLSLILFSFRSLVENGTQVITSFVDRDPSVKSLLFRIGNRFHHSHGIPNIEGFHHQLPRRRPILHLTRIGNPDRFSPENVGHDVINPNRDAVTNGSYLIVSNFASTSGFSNFVIDNGIDARETVRHGVQFKLDSSYKDSKGDKSNSIQDQDLIQATNVEFLGKGIDSGDVATLFFLVSFISATYRWVILGFTALYSWISGVILVVVVNDCLQKFNSTLSVLWDGSKLGIQRLGGFIILKWAIRDAMTQLMGLWFFGGVEDQYSFFRLFVRLKLMPFSITMPWVREFERETGGFLFTWFLLDSFISFLFAVGSWVAIADARKSRPEVVTDACYLISTMPSAAIKLKFIEATCCGWATRWALSKVLGKLAASFLQSVFETYFTATWLMFYLAARCKELHSEGRILGTKELEELLDITR